MPIRVISAPRPCVEIVSTPRGSISVRTSQSTVLGDLQVGREVHQQCGGNQVALGVVEIDSRTARKDGRVEWGERRTARRGLQVHEHEVRGDAGPIGEMREVQGKHFRFRRFRRSRLRRSVRQPVYAALVAETVEAAKERATAGVAQDQDQALGAQAQGQGRAQAQGQVEAVAVEAALF